MTTTFTFPFHTATFGLRRVFTSLLQHTPLALARLRPQDPLDALIAGLASSGSGSRGHEAAAPRSTAKTPQEHDASRAARMHADAFSNGRGRADAHAGGHLDGSRQQFAPVAARTNDAPVAARVHADASSNRRRRADAYAEAQVEPQVASRVEAAAGDPREAAPYVWARAVADLAGIDLDAAARPSVPSAPSAASAHPASSAAGRGHAARPVPGGFGEQPPTGPTTTSVPRRAMRTGAGLALIAAIAVSGAACRTAEDPNVVRLNGRLEAAMVDIAPKVTGRVSKVLVREGDRVKAGDLLITLDLGETALAVDRDRAGVESAQARARDMEAGSRRNEISAAEAEVSDRVAAVDLAKRELERQQFLLGRKVGTERDTDRAKTDLDRAAAALKSSRDRLALTREGFRKWQTTQAHSEVSRAQVQLRQSETVAAEAELRAPADAVVLHRIAEPGLLLAAGQSGLTLAFADRLYVRTFVPETKLGQVKQGGAAEVTVDAFPGRSFPGRITEISLDAEFTPKAVETRAERVNLVYAAKVDLDRGWKEPLVPGQPAEVVVRLQADGTAASAAAGSVPSGGATSGSAAASGAAASGGAQPAGH